MSEAKVIFTLDCVNLTIQCSINDKMGDICQKFATKVNKDINSLIFLYEGNKVNFELKFKEQANLLDRNKNEMKILVYNNENDEFICPKCGEKIKLNTDKIDEIILSNNEIKETIEATKLQIENIIKESSVNSTNIRI